MKMSRLPSEVVSELRNSFESGKTKPLPYRITQLKNLLKMYEENEDQITDALWSDLRKSKGEALVMEVGVLISDVKCMLYNIHSWSRREYVEKDLAFVLDTPYIQREPYGVALVIGSWNYPFLLTLSPVHGAIAAGNCVIIKPSEVSSASSKVMAELIPKYLDSDCFKVFTGGVPETTQLLKERFDYIFFTGNTAVGKIVHAAATKHLTPVTLELGGKSPCFISKSVNIKRVAKRLMWGKLANVGQTCVAPDYVLCTKEVENKLLEAIKEVIIEFHGKNPKESPNLGRIINDNHFKRLQALLKSGKVGIGGECDPADRYIAPTILIDVSENDPVMQEEIFGPILPIITVNSTLEGIKFVNKREKPLALYIFSDDNTEVDLIVNNTSSGGICVNDTIMHLTLDSLPFGGVGNSGMGHYHGKFSFDTFSHKKAVLHKNLGAIGEALSAAKYPPLSVGKLVYLNIMMGKRPFNFGIGRCTGNAFAFLFGVLSYYLWNLYGKQYLQG